MAQIKRQKAVPRTPAPKPLAPAKKTPAPKATTMPYKPSGSKPKATLMPYRPKKERKPAGPVPSEISKGPQRPGSSGPAPSGPSHSTLSKVAKEQERRPSAPSMDDKVYRSMPITEPQLKKIKKMYGIE